MKKQRIKVFTSGKVCTHNKAGDHLTEMCEKWINNATTTTFEIISIHTNSSDYGWSLTILYNEYHDI